MESEHFKAHHDVASSALSSASAVLIAQHKTESFLDFFTEVSKYITLDENYFILPSNHRPLISKRCIDTIEGVNPSYHSHFAPPYGGR